MVCIPPRRRMLHQRGRFGSEHSNNILDSKSQSDGLMIRLASSDSHADKVFAEPSLRWPLLSLAEWFLVCSSYRSVKDPSLRTFEPS